MNTNFLIVFLISKLKVKENHKPLTITKGMVLFADEWGDFHDKFFSSFEGAKLVGAKI
jgi:hypothetical protein